MSLYSKLCFFGWHAPNSMYLLLTLSWSLTLYLEMGIHFPGSGSRASKSTSNWTSSFASSSSTIGAGEPATLSGSGWPSSGSCACTSASCRLLSTSGGMLLLSTSTSGGFGVDVEVLLFAFEALSYNATMLTPFFFIYDTRSEKDRLAIYQNIHSENCRLKIKISKFQSSNLVVPSN